MILKISGLSLLCLCFFIGGHHMTDAQTWYVRPHGSRCPPDVAPLLQCKELSDYLNNTESYFRNDTAFEFLTGQHELNDLLHISGVHNLSLSCYRPAAAHSYCAVKCTTLKGGIKITDASEISIRYIHMLSCNSWRTDVESVSLLFHGVRNIEIVGVVISGSNGRGMVANASHGYLQIRDSSFTGNRKGNVMTNFSNSSDEGCSLNIVETNFTDGGCDSYNEYNVAGGLTVHSQCHGITINIQQVSVQNNTGNIKLEMKHIHWYVVINESEVAQGHKFKDAGLSLQSYFWQQRISDCSNINKTLSNNFKMIKTNISFNEAQNSSAGLWIGVSNLDCIPTIMEIRESVFNRNKITRQSSINEAVIKILNYEIIPVYHTLQTTVTHLVHLVSTEFNNNLVSSINQGSIVEIENIRHIRIENCSFIDNTGTALSLKKSSNVFFKGEVNFLNNSGYNGGAMRLCSSSTIFIHNYTKVVFQKNRAKYAGGAIFTEKPCLERFTKCFFQPVVDQYTHLEQLKDMTLVFMNNTANAGNAVFGGVIDHCYTLTRLVNKNKSSSLYSRDVFYALFKFTQNHSVASDPYKVLFCSNSTNIIYDPNYAVHARVIPGRWFKLYMVPIGQLNGTAPGMIIANLCDKTNMTLLSKISNVTVGCREISLCVKTSKENSSATIVLSVLHSMQGSINRNKSIHIRVEPCPWGFYLASDDGVCKCANHIIPSHRFLYECNLHAEEVVLFIYSNDYRSFSWLGCLEKNTQKNCSKGSFAVADNCGNIAYCSYHDPGKINITRDTVDKQCAQGRTGRLCGSCVDGYSLVLGTSRCKPCLYGYIGLVVLYLGAGILFIVILVILSKSVTVTNGSLNGLLFYVDFIHYNESLYFPHFYNGDIPRIFIAWLNLDLGIEVCFYNGMDTYQKIWLQIGYIFYICFLLLAIIFLSRKYVRFTRLMGRNAARIISTMIFILYSKILQKVYEILLPTTLTTVNGTKVLLWSMDGNHEYFSTLHIPLLVVATLLNFLLLGFTFSLLFIQIINKKISKWKCCKWISRFHPFFEAFTGPCNKHYLFWPGLLLFSRSLYKLLSITLNSNQDLNTYTTFILSISGSLVSVHFLLPKGIYKYWLLNVQEVAILLNLVVITLIARSKLGGYHQNERLTETSVSVVIAFVTFSSFYFQLFLKKFKAVIVKMLKLVILRLQRGQGSELQPTATESEARINEEVLSCDEKSPLHTQDMRSVTEYKKFRESLLEEGT